MLLQPLLILSKQEPLVYNKGAARGAGGSRSIPAPADSSLRLALCPLARCRPRRVPAAAARGHRADQTRVLLRVLAWSVRDEEAGLFQHHHAG